VSKFVHFLEDLDSTKVYAILRDGVMGWTIEVFPTKEERQKQVSALKGLVFSVPFKAVTIKPASIKTTMKIEVEE
jgi:hypothetical protein